jgi:hypothetical protein
LLSGIARSEGKMYFWSIKSKMLSFLFSCIWTSLSACNDNRTADYKNWFSWNLILIRYIKVYFHGLN